MIAATGVAVEAADLMSGAAKVLVILVELMMLMVMFSYKYHKDRY